LIDFASVAEGPLTVDPAALDVSLMMDTELVTDDERQRESAVPSSSAVCCIS